MEVDLSGSPLNGDEVITLSDSPFQEIGSDYHELESTKIEFERLPRTILPSHYEIFIEPNYLTCETFNGIITIHVTVVDVTKFVKFHSVSINILEVTFEDDVTKEVKRSADITLDDEKEVVTIEFESAMSRGKGMISILFIASILDTMKGFFRTKYTTPQGERYSFGTHFEPTFARHAFPCMDEPNLKATFDVSLVVPINRTALSNMPLLTRSPYEQNPGNYEILKFATTPVMSTYLLAFVIGEYDVVEGTTKAGVTVRAFTPLQKKIQGEFGLNVAIKCLEFYNDYFTMPYPLPKLDLVSFTSFSYGAMENWGLITFREDVFLVDPVESSSITTQLAAIVVATEISHQWFGNLVTMDWWTDLWLNESFASFIAYLCVDFIFPGYQVWTQFVTGDLIPALNLDGLSASHPVEVDMCNPSDVLEVFDTISYCKGSSLLFMLLNYLGKEPFRKGLSNYLNLFAYGNAKTTDFWRSLEESSNIPVLKMMKTWTRQMGCPLVKIVDVRTGGTANTRSITITQEKLCSNPKYSMDKTEFGDAVWIIPLCFTKGSQPESPAATLLMDGTQSCMMDFLIPEITAKEWIKLNSCVRGFYRVDYPTKMLNKFLPSIRNRTMVPLDRLNLLDDFFAMVKCGESSTCDLLRFLEAFVEENDYSVWEGMNEIFGGVKEMLEFTDLVTTFHSWANNFLRRLADQLGWDAAPQESHLMGLFRSSVLVRLVSLNDEVTIAEGKKRFQRHVSKETLVPPNIRSPVYRAAVATGDTVVYDALIALYRGADLLEEKNRILRALGSTSEPELINRILTFVLTDEVKAHDILPILLNMVGSKEGKESAWAFFKTNFHIFKEKFPEGQMLNVFLKKLVEGFCTEEMALEVETFFKENRLKGTQRSVDQAVEMIHVNLAWRRRDIVALRAFLNSRLEVMVI